MDKQFKKKFAFEKGCQDGKILCPCKKMCEYNMDEQKKKDI